MKKYIKASIIIACFLLYLPALAEQVRQLSWQDLIPAHLEAENPFTGLTQDQKDLLYWVIYARANLSVRGQQTDDSLRKEINKAILELKKDDIDIDKVMAKIDEIRTSIVEELDGQRVRIPGYFLPLETSFTKVTEFLLVPYFGACIHVPPPPPNQIVHVKVAKDDGYESRELFEAVWVTGVISARSMVKDLFLSDGTAGINIGYAIQATKVEPYN
jgi:hypothetical protein